MNQDDHYKTIETASGPVLFKAKQSKFFAYAFPANTVSEVKNHLANLKQTHHSARHCCYAYQLGVETIEYRANDDGEPTHSAGSPIYGQIQHFEITNVLVVVIRYFGGVKLGVGGLVAAYRTAAKQVLEDAAIVRKMIVVHCQIRFDYKEMNAVMQLIKRNNIEIIEQQMALSCELTVQIRKKNAETIKSMFEALPSVALKHR